MTPTYSESPEEAAQIARQTLPFVTKHELAANPVNYAVFYEYFSGTNTALRDAADRAASLHGSFSQEVVSDLYLRFVAKEDPQFVAKIQGELRGLVQSMMEALTAADLESNHYQTQLNAGLAKLADQSTVAALHGVITSLIEDTKIILKSNTRLNKRLETANYDLGTLQQQLEFQRSAALTDPLTGLANRRAFDQIMSAAMERANTDHQPLTVLMVDIDHFKKVNDTHGHLVGDQALRFVANVLVESVRGDDVVSRYGGEEFAIILIGTSMEGAKLVAEKIRVRVADRPLMRVRTGISIGRITVSIGAALYKNGETVEQFVDRADHALYAAKQQGRDRVIVSLE